MSLNPKVKHLVEISSIHSWNLPHYNPNPSPATSGIALQQGQPSRKERVFATTPKPQPLPIVSTSRAEIYYPATDIRYPAETIKSLLSASSSLIFADNLTDKALLDMFVYCQESPEDDILELFPTKEEVRLVKDKTELIVPHTTQKGRDPRTAGSLRKRK